MREGSQSAMSTHSVSSDALCLLVHSTEALGRARGANKPDGLSGSP